MRARRGEDRFENRAEAGRALAERLDHHRDRADVVVLGLARGGLPVAFEVAQALGARLDVMVVRKLGTPGQEELAMGAIGPGGARVTNPDVLELAGVDSGTVEAVAAREQRELERRERAYRGAGAAADLRGRCVIVVDDGVATGASMRAGLAAVELLGAATIVVATPTASREALAELEGLAEEVIAVRVPERFGAVGEAYRSFDQTDDEEVRRLLARARGPG